MSGLVIQSNYQVKRHTMSKMKRTSSCAFKTDYDYLGMTKGVL